MDLFANILFAGGVLIGMGCCMFVAAAIMAIVMLDD